MWRTIAVLVVALSAAVSAEAATFTVTTNADSGAGSLRQAITDANANPGADTINFNIPGAGVHTIVLTTWLPNTTDPVTVDGYTQPGSSPNTLPLAQGTNAVLNVEIDGSAVILAPCWSYQADGGLIRGLVINRCPDGALQKYVPVSTKSNSVLEVVWSPSACGVYPSQIQSLKEIREKGVVMQRWENSCAAAALATMLLLAPVLGLLPNATLAAVVIVYSVGLIQPAEFRGIPVTWSCPRRASMRAPAVPAGRGR